MRTKKMSAELIENTKNLVILMLLASRDCYVNQKREVFRFDTSCGYYGEAFGILRGLKLCGYGYFGATNTPTEIQNFRWWFSELSQVALDEEALLGLQWARNKYTNLVNKK